MNDDLISRQAAIARAVPLNLFGREVMIVSVSELENLPSAQPDKSCDGCRYENADDGVLIPCGFCKRSHSDNYERRTE